MSMKMLVEALLKILLLVNLAYILWLNIFVGKESASGVGVYTQIPLALIPVIGAIYGLISAHHWGGLTSVLGKTMTFLSLGLLSWGGGMVGWLMYIFVLGQTEVPYPSPADFVFMLSQMFWLLGSIYLARVIGAQYGLRSKNGKLLVVLVPICAVLISYILLVLVARDGVLAIDAIDLKTFFDIYYPTGTTTSLAMVSVVFFLSHKFLGGKYRSAVLTLYLGFVCQYIGDFWYSYGTTKEIYFNGHWTDMMFTLAMFLIAKGIMGITPEIDGE